MSLKVRRPKLYSCVSASPLTPFTITRHPHQHANHTTYASMPSTPHTCWHATHASTLLTPPTLARQPHQHEQHAIIKLFGVPVFFHKNFLTHKTIHFHKYFLLKNHFFEEKFTLGDFNTYSSILLVISLYQLLNTILSKLLHWAKDSSVTLTKCNQITYKFTHTIKQIFNDLFRGSH